MDGIIKDKYPFGFNISIERFIKLNHMVFPSFFLLAVALVGTFFNPFELYGGFPIITSKEEGKYDGNDSCK